VGVDSVARTPSGRMCGMSRWWCPAAQRKLLLEANRRPPSLVDVSRGSHRGPGRRRGDSGPACASVFCAAVAAIRRSCCTRPVPWGSQWRDPGSTTAVGPPHPWGSSRSGGGDTHTRCASEGSAMLRHRRPVHHGIAGSAVPAGMPTAAMSKADDVPNEDLVQAE
jgi:hypothetical protein